ncbi:DUF883 family protein [Azoarcus sp. TTM-91]|uniref:glycine zipper domain-containing protein n=1 Tax=Azoarcus sp. TTM-91 TaxID=2691581 RepID=UPI00145D1728|nr:DUF883 family protein [Azoarcus sp. TTM-91]NMG35158.1 DUF883 family protein [Azoarcus sp. TTM-91]
MTTTTGSTIAGASEQGAARLERLSGSAQEAVGRVTEAAASAMRDVGARGEELGHQLMDKQEVWMENARGCVRDHPLAAVAAAVGVGLLLSRLLSR